MQKSLVVLGAAVVALTAACGSSSKSGTSGGDTRKLNVTITSKGCAPATMELAPGPATFEVENDGADSITEYELKQGNSIVGEAENLTPGLKGNFTVTLKPGEYEGECPGGDSSKITVTGDNTATTVPAGGAAAAAGASYKQYVSKQTEVLVKETKEFTDAVKAGDVAKAKEEFPKARAAYESVEPVAESFGDLDPEIDAREGDVPAAQWGGFHRIEKQLWVEGNTDGMTPVADKLLADVTKLHDEIPGLELEPAQIANGSVDLMNEVAKSKVTGEEDRYSHTDLSDFRANVDGAKAAFEALEPMVKAKDEALVTAVDAQFKAVDDALDVYKKGDTYVLYTTLTKADTKALAEKVDALADQLSKVAPTVVG